MIKNLTKEEEQMIKIFRLVRKISVKFSIGYYSITNTMGKLNKHYYFPNTSHRNFDTPEETIKSLKNILKLSYAEFMEHLTKEETKKKIKELKEQKDALEEKIKKISEVI